MSLMAGDDSRGGGGEVPRHKNMIWPLSFIFSIVVVPVLAGILLYALDEFDPSPLKIETARQFNFSTVNHEILDEALFIGSGILLGPEDLVYDAQEEVIYTACLDGWIKRVRIGEIPEVVENWVFLGGRPLGIALGLNHELIVAHPDKGLLNVSSDGSVRLLTEETDGEKFMFADGVDVAEDGTIYFTDASSKYGFNSCMLDLLERRPYGRLLSYHPSTQRTQVLARDLYFPNGVAVSPNQDTVVFCETAMRRCRRYHVRGLKRGSVENLIEKMTVLPDNIKYDGEGRYWIGFATETTPFLDIVLNCRVIRKILAILHKQRILPNLMWNGGVMAIDVGGNPIAQFHDRRLSTISSGFKIGNRVFCGSVFYPHLITFNLTTQLPPPHSNPPEIHSIDYA